MIMSNIIKSGASTISDLNSVDFRENKISKNVTKNNKIIKNRSLEDLTYNFI